jgi:hypothetical protein
MKCEDSTEVVFIINDRENEDVDWLYLAHL